MKPLTSPLKSMPIKIYLIVALGFLLRVLWLPNNLFFGFEQGRDLLAVRNIIFSHTLTLIGPNTDIQGIYHGALSYYLLVPYYLLGFGDPILIIMLLILTNCLAVVFLYKSTKELFGDRTATLTSLFYVLSYSAIIYSRWLSNPNLIPAVTIFIFYFLVKSKANSKYLICSAFLWAVLFHLSLATAATLIAPILVFILVFEIKPSIRILLLSLFSIIIVLSTYIVFDLRHEFLLSKGILNYLHGGAVKSGRVANLDVFGNEIVSNLFPPSRVASIIFFFVIVSNLIAKITNKQHVTVLCFLVLPPLMFLVLGINPLRHIFITTPIFVSIGAALAVMNLKRVKMSYWAWFLAVLIIVGNLWENIYSLPSSKNNFLQQEQRTYIGDEKKIVDYIYTDASNSEFSYDYYTIPYWQRQGWQYLFSSYGKNKYGYVPSENRTQVFYVVIEEDLRQPVFQKNWHNSLNDHSTIVSSYSSGKLTVEKRAAK